jgi:hypothetical protein
MISRTIFTACAIALLHVANAVAADFAPIVWPETEYLVGGRAGGKWLDSQEAARLVKGGEMFRLFSFAEEIGRAKGGKPKSAEEPCPDTQVVELSLKAADAVIAIAASWNPMPRKPRDAATTQPVYIEAVRDFLGTKGLSGVDVKITRIVRVDLDGDGEDEVLISATNYGGKTGVPSAKTPDGGYSFVLLRRVVGRKVDTQLVEGEFYPKGKEFHAPNAYQIVAVLDLDGDGKLEVLVRSDYYEGGALTVYTFEGGEPKDVITTGCGA